MTRFGWTIATYVAAFGATASVFLHPLPRLIWNASASVPIGLYAVHPVGKLDVTELVVVRPPPALAQFLAERRYLPEGVPMLKRVLALPGQTVCRSDRAITVDGIAMGDALDHDTRGRPLPVWQGCQRVPENRIFLMNWQSVDSFDGRYFGLLSRTTILGRADPVWTQEED
jgi:conjugative transfer signal peptidase TraF